MSYPINTTVREIGQISIQGNIIPNEWYTHLKNEKGKIQTNAALILADIVYWYRPIPIYGFQTGEFEGYGKKFKDDILQIDYKYFNTKFGFSEVQSRSALIFLEKKGFIFREFRDVNIGHHVLNNVMYIGIYPDKISAITPQSENNCSHSLIKKPLGQPSLQTTESHNPPPKLLPQIKPKQKDWAAKFTDEQKVFLDYLLNIKPEIGESIERNHATWWIKSFGIEKIKIALQVYWQRVDMAKNDSTVPMPQHIGKYIRKALNDGLTPSTNNETSTQQDVVIPPCSQKSNQVVTKIEPGGKKNVTTYTDISMMSMNINEVNDSASLTFQKEEEQEKIYKKQSIKETQQEIKPSQPIIKTSYSKHQKTHKQTSRKSNQEQDWKQTFTSDEKKFLASLLGLIPAVGDKIEEKHATWWIKHFGIDKIKIALQVYWQQVEKAKKDSKVPLPQSIGAYVREALNKSLQPCRETDRRNKTFSEQFKKQMNWRELKITEKYCRAEDIGKEWHYNLPEAVFIESLKRTFENYCSLTERQSCVA